MNDYDKDQSILYREEHEVKCKGAQLTLKVITFYKFKEGYPKEILAEINDENDPMFWYKLKLTQNDFLDMKRAQDLIVDFHQFPEKAVQLLQTTKKENSRMYISFEVKHEHALLSVLEEKDMRLIDQMSLRFEKVSETEVLKRAVELIKMMKNESKRLKREVRESKACIEEKQCEYAELDRMQQERIQALDGRYASELAAIEQEKKQKLKQVEEENSEKRKELDIACKKLKEKLEANVNEVKTLGETREKLQLKVKDLSEELRKETDENDQLKKDLKILKVRLVQENKKSIKGQNQIDKLNEMLEERRRVIVKLQQAYHKSILQTKQAIRRNEVLYQQNQDLKERAERAKAEVADATTLHETAQADLKKANHVIESLFSQLLKLRSDNKKHSPKLPKKTCDSPKETIEEK